MSVPIEKLAPTAVVMAVAAWCCWPYFGESAPRAAGGDGKLPTIAESLLRPSIKPPCRRDPFYALTPAASGTGTIAALALSSVGNPEDAAVAAPAAADEEASAASVGDPQGAVAGPDVERILDGLVLDATYVRGDRRFAIISGRVCRRGQQVDVSGSGTQRYVVKEVLPGKVLLQWRHGTLELAYRSLLEETPRRGQGLERDDE